MNYDNTGEERNFFQKYGFACGVVVLGLAAVGVFAGRSFSTGKPMQRKGPDVLAIRLPPMPTPPPPAQPPPPPQQKLEQKMIEQAPVDDKEEKPDDKPQEAAPALVTNLTGQGPDGFGLGRSGAGSGMVGGSGRHRSGSRWGWYAAKVQARIGDALRKGTRTKAASISNLIVRVWPDATTGRIVRAKLAESTGDRGLDSVMTDEVLTGLQLDEPPPAGMPAPIVMRINARRPQSTGLSSN